MTTLAPASLSTEILESTLLTLDEKSTSITVLALNASHNPEHSPGVRDLLQIAADCRVSSASPRTAPVTV